MFAKTIEALKAVEVAAKEELDALWIPYDPQTGTGAVHWNAQGAGALGEALSVVTGLRTGLEPKQAAHEEAQAAAAAATPSPAEPVTEPATTEVEPVTESAPAEVTPSA